MEQRLIAVPSIALSISVLALGATIGSGGCRTAPAPAALGLSVRLGFGLNLSTLAPLLTLAWHAFSLLSPYLAPAAAAAAASHNHYRPLSDSASTVTGEDHRPSTGIRTCARVWVPYTLALLWLLVPLWLLVLFVPRWSSATAFSYAGLALLSAFEAGVLALGGMLARCQIQRELAGETDDEYQWESDQGDGDDDVKLGEILHA